ncbi:rh58 [macacine betaherpesvirus 3]|uniref:Rh58 n=1 Tax=Rhesus cytomegalovirus (strain 68-1) TaxID=47929 RepID=Q2FAR2_RHCM6|nr:rh58 [macacine betaherpesvirus 3]
MSLTTAQSRSTVNCRTASEHHRARLYPVQPAGVHGPTSTLLREPRASRTVRTRRADPALRRQIHARHTHLSTHLAVGPRPSQRTVPCTRWLAAPNAPHVGPIDPPYGPIKKLLATEVSAHSGGKRTPG